MSEKPLSGRFAHRWHGLVLERAPGDEVIPERVAPAPYDLRRS
jgi:hypothetical protein